MDAEDPLQDWLLHARAAGPGPGFRERVMARVRRPQPLRRRLVQRLAVAALLVASLGLVLVRSGACCLWLLQSSMEAF